MQGNIEVDMKGIMCEDVDCAHLTQDSARWRAFGNSNDPSRSTKDREFCDHMTASQFSRMAASQNC
jgi:exonuclease III